MAKYRIIDVENTDKFTELARISFNLRHFSKIWKEHFGAKNRINLAYWEQKLDEFLKVNIEATPEEEIIQKIVSENEIWTKAGSRAKLPDNTD